ncbi:flagellin N-terminal-like domain-containing protein [Methanolobus vulcani]|uniref:Flagellin N-terminal-like domain-containing protein n=1 Tax=Methanolobus vulcani TaxID=38026 RepID=A0A7Z7AX40_9EURY|nr:archaellin/type IV pilin N-terminal domain-containing protein [Methanolobus vulcani]SDF94249.1 flagellin N-terminal-like domain-containing protein [Methanolobus vulcani]
MAGNDMKAFLDDNRGVTVIFGTLLLILITIIAASSVAYMISITQKQAMDLESHQQAVENENLKIVSIDPHGDGSNWESIDLKILNLNTQDSYISAIRINDGYFLYYRAYDTVSAFDVYKDYTAIYSANHRVLVPATKSKTLHLNFSDITLSGSEVIPASPSWTNTSHDYTYALEKHPWESFGKVPYTYNVTYSSNGTKCIETNNFSIDNENMKITFFGTNSGGNLTNITNYNIAYTINFTSYAGATPSKNDPIKAEIITSYINVFKELFTPPMPLADVQFKAEQVPTGNNSFTYDNYLILDASDSLDPDGFITDYKWAVWEDSNLIYDYNLSGMIVRYDPLYTSNVTIDLQITDDDGMTSRLSQVSGYVKIY